MKNIKTNHGCHFDYEILTRPGLCLVSSYVRKSKSSSKVGERIIHPFWVLDYTINNSGKSRVAGRNNPWFERKAHIGHLYPPNTPYWEDSRGMKGEILSTFIIFEGGESVGLHKLTENDRKFASFLDPDRMLLEKLLKMARIEQKNKGNKLLIAQGELYLTVDMLFNAKHIGEGEYVIGEQPEERTDNSNLSSRIKSYFRENIRENISLDELAAKFNVSASTLSHTYKKESGEGPISTLVKMRINFAKGMILKGIPLKEVADESGFYDEYYLSKMFKKVIGISPREYRNAKE